MKTPSPVSHLASLALAFSLATISLSAMAATPTVCPSYTFVGRITDASHTAFDADRVATFTVAATNGTLLARSKTFYRDDSTRNYALLIPVASSEVNGYALQGDTVTVSVLDDNGRTWEGVINPATIGAPGTVSEVDIILAEDTNGDGIDDSLFAELEAGWESSSAYDPDATYDPSKFDSDGDGISDLDEALLGTNPFNAEDILAIQSFTASPMSLKFESPGGHTFAVETSSSLSPDDADWHPVPIATDPDAKSSTRTLYTIPSSAKSTTHTLYLFPTSSPAFFRLAPQ